MMEEMLLSTLGGRATDARVTHPPMELADLDQRVCHLQASAIECSTVKGYAMGARDYINFCTSHGLSLDPTPQTLSCYIAYTSQFIASAPKYLTGACHFLCDIYPHFDDNRLHPLVTTTICGSKKLRADPVKRKLPLRTVHLETFLQVADCSGSYDDLLFATILSCAFYACHRMGELVQKNDKSLFDWRKIIKWASLCFENGHAQYHLPYHKSDPLYRGTDILFTSQTIADPVGLLHMYTMKCDSLHGSRAALWLRQDGSHPTRSWFDKKFFAILSHDFGGHSPRAGGTTFLAALGLSESVIQAIGQWSSAAWKIYIQENPTIHAEQELATVCLRSS
jgi:hypothetical protein